MSRNGMIFSFFENDDDYVPPPKKEEKIEKQEKKEEVDPEEVDPEEVETLVDYRVLGQPDDLDNFGIYRKEIDEAVQWVRDFQKVIKEGKGAGVGGGAGGKAAKFPRILMLMGKKGCGKTLMAKLLFKKFNYDLYDVKNKLEILGTNHKSITNKQLVEQFHNVISYKNLNEFKKEATTYGLLFDDVECMIETGDSPIFNEMVSLVKSAMKPEPIGKDSKSGNGSGGKSGKGKGGKGATPNILEMMEAASSDPAIIAKRTLGPPRLYNPIICTCNYTTDKKMTELKKLCKVIDLGTPSYDQYQAVFERLLKRNGIEIRGDREALERDLFEHFEYDIRKIYEFVDNVRRLATYNGYMDQAIVDLYKYIYTKADMHCQVNDATIRILSTALNVEESTLLYYMDTLSIPLMVHHNMLDYIEESATDCADFKTQFDTYMGSLQSLCDYDQTQTLTYKYHSWDLLPTMSAFQSVYIPNLYFQKLGPSRVSASKIKIAFTNILNKISQLEVNRKMVQNAYFSANRLMIDDDELMYVIEIFLNLLQIQRTKEEDEDGVSEDAALEEVKEVKEEVTKKSASSSTGTVSKKKGGSPVIQELYTLEKSPYKRIIEIMNHYNIDIPSLEIILKIEKLNIFENKNPKRFTAKIRDELEKFVTAQASQYAGEGDDAGGSSSTI